MLGFLVRRIAQAIVVVLGVVLIVFILSQLIPGGECRAVLGPKATFANCARFNRLNGFNLPVWDQFYHYVLGLLQGNLGYSYKFNQGVTAVIMERLPKTLVLVGTSTLVALIIAIPLFLVAGFCIGAPNPGLDAARLDVMPSRMWGRGEAVRSFLRSLLQAFAPLVFGVLSSVFGGRAVGFGVSAHGADVKNAAAHAVGLEQTFLIMLAALAGSAVVVWWGRKPYPIDVAAVIETERRFPPVREPGRGPGPEGASGAPVRTPAPSVPVVDDERGLPPCAAS
jgi:hypothetical protein